MHPIHFCQRNPDCSRWQYAQPQGMKHSCPEPTMASLLPFYRNLFPQLSLEKHAAVGSSSGPMRCKGKSSGGEERGVMGGVLERFLCFSSLIKWQPILPGPFLSVWDIGIRKRCLELWKSSCSYEVPNKDRKSWFSKSSMKQLNKPKMFSLQRVQLKKKSHTYRLSYL